LEKAKKERGHAAKGLYPITDSTGGEALGVGGITTKKRESAAQRKNPQKVLTFSLGVAETLSSAVGHGKETRERPKEDYVMVERGDSHAHPRRHVAKETLP